MLHRQNSRASGRPSTTAKFELLALIQAIRSVCNLKNVFFQRKQKDVSIELHIENQRLWDNLVNSTSLSLSKILLCGREYIRDGKIAGTRFIPCEHSTTYPFTKQCLNQKHVFALLPSNLVAPRNRDFMLQNITITPLQFYSSFNRSNARRNCSRFTTSFSFHFFLSRTIFLPSTTPHFFRLVPP